MSTSKWFDELTRFDSGIGDQQNISASIQFQSPEVTVTAQPEKTFNIDKVKNDNDTFLFVMNEFKKFHDKTDKMLNIIENSNEKTKNVNDNLLKTQNQFNIKCSQLHSTCNENKNSLDNKILGISSEISIIENQIQTIKQETKSNTNMLTNIELAVKENSSINNNITMHKSNFIDPSIYKSIELLPKFYNQHKQYYPIKFLDDLNSIFYMYNIPENIKVNLAKSKLSENLEIVLEMSNNNIESFDEFSNWIKTSFWNAQIQAKVKLEFLSNENRGQIDKNLANHFFYWKKRTRYFEPKILDSEFISIILMHFKPNIAVLLKSSSHDVSLFLEQITFIDEVYGNNNNVNTTLIKDLNQNSIRKFHQNENEINQQTFKLANSNKENYPFKYTSTPNTNYKYKRNFPNSNNPYQNQNNYYQNPSYNRNNSNNSFANISNTNQSNSNQVQIPVVNSITKLNEQNIITHDHLN